MPGDKCVVLKDGHQLQGREVYVLNLLETRVRFTPADTTGMGRKTFTLNGGNVAGSTVATPRRASAAAAHSQMVKLWGGWSEDLDAR